MPEHWESVEFNSKGSHAFSRCFSYKDYVVMQSVGSYDGMEI